MKYKPLLLAFLLTALLAGCTLPSSAEGSSLILSEPVDGATYQVGDMVQARSQIVSSDGAAQVDLLVNGEIVRSDSPSPVVHQGNLLQPWKPEQAGTYTLQTQMTTTSGAKVQSQSVTIQVGGVTEPLAPPTTVTVPPIATTPPTSTFTPTPTFTATFTSTPAPPTTVTVPPIATTPPTSTFTPTPTFTATFTSTPAPPTVTAFQDANCRFGPGSAYNITGSLLNGESAPIVGRNAETTWWVIQTKSGATCWIWDGTVSVSGDTSRVPVIAPPPTPTFTPEVTPLSAPAPIAPSGELTCRSSVFLEWSAVSHPNGIDHYEWQVTGPGGTQSGSANNTKVEFFVSCSSSYTWQVRAVDGDGNAGPYSDAMSFQIK
ncbi:MAG: hypothetical protein FJZ86_04485 [Chloroflexi bacterium]|nr:hypothetical protein [Chloroflexota bacterium]